MNSISGMVEQRLDDLVEIGLIGRIDLGSDLQRNASLFGDLDRAIRSLFRGDAAEECKILPADLVEGTDAWRQSVVNRRQPVHMRRHRSPLAVGDRDQRHLVEGSEHRHEVGQVEPAMQGRQALMRQILEEDMLQQVDMEMDDVELIGPGPDLIQHDEMAGDVVADAGKASPFGTQGTSFADVVESPLANKVTSWPCRTSSSVSQETTRSVPP